MEHYTKRLLNPFNGTVRVIADTEIRALSFNARDWELQFRCDSPKGVRYARIGTWCRQTGFKPYPLPPDIDVAAVEVAHSKMSVSYTHLDVYKRQDQYPVRRTPLAHSTPPIWRDHHWFRF